MDPPAVLLLDEPFSGLDLGWKYNLLDLVSEAVRRRKTTVIMVSHSIEDAVLLSHRVYLLRSQPMQIAKCINVDIPHASRDHLDGQLVSIQQSIKEQIVEYRRELQSK